MIARVWSAQTTHEHAPAYANHLKTEVLPALKRIDGYTGGMLLERAIAGAVEIIVITFWRSTDALRAFAGADLESAVVADKAALLLTRFDKRVRHYVVAVKEDGSPLVDRTLMPGAEA